MKSILRTIGLVSLFVFAIAFAADKAIVADLLKEGSKFDGKIVTVTGKLMHFKAKTSKAGNKYFTFDLEDGGKKLNVYGKGELDPTPKAGDTVEVTGEFVKEREMNDFTIKNEIDVTKGKEKESEKNGVKVLPAKNSDG